MNSKTEMMQAAIAKGHTVRIQDGKGLEVTVVTGSLWVTYENDAKDFVVSPSETFRVNRDGLTLVHAFREAQLRIAYPAEAGAPSLTFAGGYREFGSSVVRSMVAEWLRGIRARFAPATKPAHAA
jgi:hypothetical protein